MTQEEIRQLEKELWDAADELRSNSKLTAAEYKDPLLGLVLLRFAQNRYEDAKIEIAEKLPVNPRTGEKRIANKTDFAAAGAILLPEKAKYDYLADLPEDEDIAKAINEAMKNIEEEYPDLLDVLPKAYQEFEDRLLRNLVRLFNKDAVKKAKGDVFGRIYEFFLMKFSMQGAGAQEGGEFFTPPSLVNLIVNFIQPNHGIIHDPACGSGGMFVQSAHFIKTHENRNVNEAITVYGTEYKSNTTRLAKMNLAIHGIEGKIINDNSFYSDPHSIKNAQTNESTSLVGKCDFVMANPPFNVDKVDAKNKFLTEDKRLPFGVPKTGKGTITNANYLWMQYFHSYLNDTGRAGFVMASSATDAGHAEKLVRQQLIESGAVECIVAVSNNFFYTRSLPCHVWFYNKGKLPKNRDKILMIDARNVYRVINSTINDFSEGQQFNLTALTAVFRGNEQAIMEASKQHQQYAQTEFETVFEGYKTTYDEYQALLKTEDWSIPNQVDLATKPEINFENIEEQFQFFNQPFAAIKATVIAEKTKLDSLDAQAKKSKAKKAELSNLIKELKRKITQLNKPLKNYKISAAEYLSNIQQSIKDWQQLHTDFPKGKYTDVEGLCKIVGIAEVIEQDYSLTPGRYVGVKIEMDMDFDYQGRMKAIHTELGSLNTEANDLMAKIQNF
jgi:type I restriction enzyme M protein